MRFLRFAVGWSVVREAAPGYLKITVDVGANARQF
jgi:hypothetical protein